MTETAMTETAMTKTDADRWLLELAIQIKDNRNARGDALQEAFYLLRDTRGATASHVPFGWEGFLKIVGISQNQALGEMTRVRAEIEQARRADRHAAIQARRAECRARYPVAARP